MRAPVAAAVGLLLLAGGAAAGWFAAGSGRGSPAAAPPTEQGRRGDEERTARGPAPAVVEPVAAPASIPDSWLSSRPMPVVRGITGSLSGSVLNESGEPLVGVEIVIQPRYPSDNQRADAAGLDEGTALAARMEVESRRLVWEERSRITLATDGAGEFRRDGVPDVLVAVFPRKAGWRFRRAVPSYWGSPEVRIGQRVDFIGCPSVDARVEVRLPDGTEPADASVKCSRGGTITREGWTPDRRVLPLPAGTSEMLAEAGPWSVFRSDPQRVTLVQGSEPPVLKFDLRSRTAVHGYLSFPGRQGPARASVFLLRAPPTGEVVPSMVRTGGQEWQAVDRNRWEFVFKDLSPGRHFLAVFTDPNGEGPALLVQELFLADSLLEIDLPIPLPDRSRFLVVRVMGPHGEAVRSARVQAQYLEDGRIRASAYEASPAEDGTFIAVFDRSRDGAFDSAATPFDPVRGHFRVTATADDWGAVAGETRTGPAPEAVLRFAEPASLSVTVEAFVGTQWQGRLRASLISGPGNGGPTSLNAPLAALNAEGRAIFAAVQPGTYELQLSLGGGRGSWSPVARVPITVSAGRAEEKFPFPALFAVRFTNARWRVSLRRSDDPRWGASTGDPGPDGVLYLDCLPAGEYTVEGGQGKSKVFIVPGTTEVQLEK